MRIKRIIVAVLIISCAALLFQGCTPRGKADDTYIMEEALDAAQYAQYLCKEIESCINAVNTATISGKQAVFGKESPDDLMLVADSAIEKVSTSLEKIRVMTPPAQYVSNRENVISILTSVLVHLEDMKSNAGGNTNDGKVLQDVVDELANDFIILTGEFNIYYK